MQKAKLRPAREKSAVEHFDRRVAGWVELAQDQRSIWHRRVRWVDEYLAGVLEPGASCLDIGCASGHLSALLAARGHTVYAVDVPESTVEAARRRLSSLGVPADRVRVTEADSLPFEDGVVDFASALQVLGYVEDQPAYLREVRRILKPGGLALLSVVNPRSLHVSLLLPARVRHLSSLRLWHQLHGLSFWEETVNLWRTGWRYGGYVNESKALQARNPSALDRFCVEAGLRPVDSFDVYNLRPLDHDPPARSKLGRWAARRGGWEHFGLYRKDSRP